MRDEMGNRLRRAKEDRRPARYGYLVKDPRPLRKQPKRRKRPSVLATNSQVAGVGVVSCAERAVYCTILEKIVQQPDRNRVNRRRAFWNRRKPA